MNRIGILVLTVVFLTTGTSQTFAQDASHPRFRGTPSVSYAGSTAGAIIRLDRKLERPRPAFVLAPTLRVGDHLGPSYGGLTPGAIGSKGRHCYLVELIQPLPRSRLRDGARWRLGLIAGQLTIRRTIRVTVKKSTESYNWQRQAMRRLGCI